MLKNLKVSLLSVVLFISMFSCLFRGYELFYNVTTKDDGITFDVRGKVYDFVSNVLCLIKLDDNGAIPDIKMPLAKQMYIIFEVD